MVMTIPKIAPINPVDLLSLAAGNDPQFLKKQLDLLQSWGITGPDYVPVLGAMLSHENKDVVRVVLGIMLNYQLFLPRKEFMQLEKYLPVFHELAPTQFCALELIVGLSGATPDLVPYLKGYLARYPEEACDLIVQFGPLAAALVSDLIKLIEKDDWDETWAAVDALAAIGKPAEEAVPVLKKLTKHKSGIITGSACVALESITGISRDHWPRGPTSID